MKKLLIILFSLGLAAGASAQLHGGGHYRGGHYSRPRVGVAVGVYAPYAPLYGYGYSPFAPYGFGYSPYRYGGYGYAVPSRLGLKIQEIENDYQDRIWAVRHDKSIPKRERKARIHELKRDRDQAVIDAKRNYYKY
jgi:hypothetical protein